MRPAFSDELAGLWAAGWPFVLLGTTDQERAVAAVRAVAGTWEASVLIWSTGAADETGQSTPGEAVATFARGAGTAVLVLLDVGDELDAAPLQRAMLDAAPALEREGRLVALVHPERPVPPMLADALVPVSLPLPDLRELASMVEPREGQAAGFERRLASAALGLSAKHARRAMHMAAACHSDADALSMVLREKRRRMGQQTALELIDSDFRLEDIGGLDSLKRWLRERANAFGSQARTFGLPPPRGVLLLGVQGCGKSMSAKVVAHLFGVPLLRLDLSRVFGGGDAPEAAMRRAIQTAERFAPAVLWIDEIEKGFAGADSEGKVVNTTAARILGSFVTWMQEKSAPVFVVATANEVHSLPPELLRRGRFDEVFFLDLPGTGARADILTVHLRRAGRDPAGYDVGALVPKTAHFSGAELEQVVLVALLRAFSETRELTQADLERAAAELVPLYRTYEERIKALRAWARHRARPAGATETVAELLLAMQAPVGTG